MAIERKDQHPLTTEQHRIEALRGATVAEAHKKHTLVDLAAEYAFFTTALICTVGRFDRDPVIEFNRAFPPEGPDGLPFAIDTGRGKFFQGIGTGLLAGLPVNWDHRLYGIVHERWELLRDFIGGIAITDSKTGHYARVCFYQMNIVDPTSLGRVTKGIPMIPITVFGISSKQNFVYIAPPQNPPLDYPTPVFEPPRTDLTVEANGVLGPPLAPEYLLAQKLRDNR